jgi:Flp pilus assembly pilin Flp
MLTKFYLTLMTSLAGMAERLSPRLQTARNCRGAGMIEYAMLALIAFIAFVALRGPLRSFISSIWDQLSGVFSG